MIAGWSRLYNYSFHRQGGHHMARLITVAALGLVLSGCVAQEKYGALKIEADSLREQLQEAQTAAAAAHNGEAAWKSQYDKMIEQLNGKDALAGLSAKEAAELRAQLEAMRAKYENALNAPGPQVVALPPELSNQISELVKQFPDVIEFDAARGVVKFKSDVTFARGSAELTPQAKQVIGRVAQILNSPVAKDYELLVAGHTDSTPVNNSATVQAGHKDNWYLSAHRALVVGKELMNNQIRPGRVGAAGYGAERPVASNGTSEGQAKNRRVEIAVLPTTHKGGPAVAGGEVSAPKKTPARELNKDTASVSPLMNK
jgi:chemotaxis protein MotB